MKFVKMFPVIAIVACGMFQARGQAASPTRVAPSAKTSLPPEKSTPVHMPRFETPPVIDGKLEEVWKSAAVLSDFIQVQPGDNIAPSKRTEVLLGIQEIGRAHV